MEGMGSTGCENNDDYIDVDGVITRVCLRKGDEEETFLVSPNTPIMDQVPRHFAIGSSQVTEIITDGKRTPISPLCSHMLNASPNYLMTVTSP